MTTIAVSAEQLGKRYRIGVARERATTRHGRIAGLAASPFDYLRTTLRPATEAETLWALRDVSFEIPEGQVVGIIGRNGAGKSTLLKILSRITEPSTGIARIHGRLGSLLEVGAGFHAELTGRDNVFLNGAILGMSRAEVQRKFDQIVEFAGVERFIDTPVKRYSSGMYVRLAFAVAAHLEPEVMLVDEVLAVGDAEFQRRCLGRMEEIGKEGRTVVFVSHQMPLISRLCERVILLDKGTVVADGTPEQSIARYLEVGFGTSSERSWPLDSAPGDDVARLRRARIVGVDGGAIDAIDVRERVGVELELEILAPGARVVPWLAFYTETGGHAFSAMDTHARWREGADPGTYRVTAWIPEHLLNEGLVTISISLNEFQAGKAVRHAHADDALAVQVFDPGEGDTARGHYGGAWPGPLRPRLEWQTSKTI